MNLLNVYRRGMDNKLHAFDHAVDILYDLLAERSDADEINISHRKMPSRRCHAMFVKRKPYLAWYLIETDGDYAGSIYLSKQGEIGVFLFRRFQGRGLGTEAIKELMRRFPGKRFLANVNPANARSIALFQKLGFNLLQHTYERRDA